VMLCLPYFYFVFVLLLLFVFPLEKQRALWAFLEKGGRLSTLRRPPLPFRFLRD